MNTKFTSKRKKSIGMGLILLLGLLLTTGIVLAQHDGAANGEPQVRQHDEDEELGITGKTEAIVGAQPWMVALVEDGYDARDGQFCGGSLIAPQWVLTAAHCIEDMVADEVDVIVGRHLLSSNSGQRIDASHLVSHPGYGDFHDIALVRLAQPATAGQPIPLVTAVNEYLDDAGAMGRITGWGIVPEIGEEYSPDALYGVNVPIISEGQCDLTYGDDVDETVICAGYEQGGADSCYGDSGGPLVVPSGNSWALAGVVSWGDGCGLPDAYGVYTRVESYESWINGYLNETAVLPDPDQRAPSAGYDEYDDAWSNWGLDSVVDWFNETWDNWLYGADSFDNWVDDTGVDDGYAAEDWSDWEDSAWDDSDDSYWTGATGSDGDEAETLLSTQESNAGFIDVYSLGLVNESIAEIADYWGSDGDLVVINGTKVLLEDWSDSWGGYYVATYVQNGELIEVSSDISLTAVRTAVANRLP